MIAERKEISTTSLFVGRHLQRCRLFDLKEEMMNKEKEIYEYLQQNHTGKENAVFSKELEQRFSLSGRALRRVISTLRKEGCPICSGCGGYYLGSNQKEVEGTASWLNELASGIADAQDNMEKIDLEAKKKGVKIIMIVQTPLYFEDEDMDVSGKQDLAQRLIKFFQENDSYAKERAREETAKKDVLQETMQMLDSDLLMRAILEVLDRVRKEESNYLKRNNYLKLMEDLQDFYDRQTRIRAYEEAKKLAQRNHLCR